MAGWLPEDFGKEMAEERASRAVLGVHKRVRAERRLKLSLLSLLLAATAASSVVLWRLANLPQAPQPASLARRAAPAEQPAPSPSGPVDITLQKAGNGVELAWAGDPKGEYVVYRCSSPRFDVCSTAGVVRGTDWKDAEMGGGSLVFYKVEPKGRS